jgi:hypothetical protein
MLLAAAAIIRDPADVRNVLAGNDVDDLTARVQR